MNLNLLQREGGVKVAKIAWIGETNMRDMLIIHRHLLYGDVGRDILLI